MTGLEGLAWLVFLFIGGVLLSISVGGGLVLWGAVRAVRDPDPDVPPPGPWDRLVSLALVIVAAGIALAPLVVAIVGPTVYGPGSLPSDSDVAVAISLALGVLTVSAARLLRHGPALGAWRLALVGALLPAGIQVWVTTEMVTQAEWHHRYGLVTDPIQLAEWPLDRLTDTALTTVTTSALAVASAAPPVPQFPEAAAIRCVVFVSAEPATPSSELSAAVTQAAGSFDIR